jgi:predicted MFS family arabinose efflux permease
MIGVGVGVSALPFYTAGLFIGPLCAQFGWTRAEASGGTLALSLGIALGAPLVGRLVDRFGARAVALPSLLVEASVFLILARLAGSPVAYVGALFAMGFLGAGASPLAFTEVVNVRFVRARGLALGICLMGAGLTATLAPALLSLVIASHGWRAAYVGLALVVLAATPLTVLLGRRVERPDSDLPPPLRGSFSVVLSQGRFWILIAASALAAFGIAGVVVHLVPILLERGLSVVAASHRASAIGVAVIVTRVLIGAALDRLSARWVGASIMAAAMFASLLLMGAAPEASFAAALLLGGGLGAEIDLISYLCARDFGLAAYGRTYGLIYAATLLAAGAGPLGFGLIADLGGGYGIALAASAVVLALSAILLLFLRKDPQAWVNSGRPPGA